MGDSNVININQFKKKQAKKVQLTAATSDEYVGELYAQDLVEEFNRRLQEEREPKNKNKK